MENNIFSLVSHKLKKLKKTTLHKKQAKLPIIDEKQRQEYMKREILKLRKKIDSLYKLTSSL